MNKKFLLAFWCFDSAALQLQVPSLSSSRTIYSYSQVIFEDFSSVCRTVQSERDFFYGSRLTVNIQFPMTSKRTKGKRRCTFLGFLLRKKKRALQTSSRRPKSKRVRSTSTRIYIKSADDQEDRISELPDDILISILSFLTTKEAAATCLLSRRWRYLWAFVPRLDCHCNAYLRDKIYFLRERQPQLCDVETERFVHWVNSVVKKHQGHILDELRIDFFLDKSSSHAVDAWIEFAFSKRVQRLVLDLSPVLLQSQRNFTFPDVLPPQTNFSFVGLTSLRTLHLKHVNVKQEVLERIISYCPVLEQLSLHDSLHLVSLKFAGPSFRLTHLSITECRHLKSIEICDTNIVSFKCFGRRKTILRLKNLPSLVELNVGPGDERPISEAFNQISDFFSQLESLTLQFSGRMSRNYFCNPVLRDDDYFDVVPYPKLTKLRHLVVRMEIIGDLGLLKLVPLINACPYLQRFALQLLWDERVQMTREIVETIACPHQYLKVVELGGYYGRTTDVEFAMHFIQNAVALERMIIDPKDSRWESPITDKVDRKRVRDSRRRAQKQLKGKVPHTIDLVIN